MAKTKQRRPTSYDRGQHELICRALGISSSPDAPGITAYEGVCILMMKLEACRDELAEMAGSKAKELLKYIDTDPDSETFCIIPLYGTAPRDQAQP
jgi:hypothetical protein